MRKEQSSPTDTGLGCESRAERTPGRRVETAWAVFCAAVTLRDNGAGVVAGVVGAGVCADAVVGVSVGVIGVGAGAGVDKGVASIWRTTSTTSTTAL